MENKTNNYLWAQFGASIDMLENAINMCPEKIWNFKNDFSDFWYLVYHTLFWLDFYLTDVPEEFTPPNNIGTSELDPEGILPYKVFNKEELINYLHHCRNKCKKTIDNINDTNANRDYKYGSINLPYFELMLYNMRHVQHHTAQLNLLLRQQINSAPGWVKRTVTA